MRDIDRILSSGGRFRNKRRHLERFLEHHDPRVRLFVGKTLRPREREGEPEWACGVNEAESQRSSDAPEQPSLFDDLEEIPF